MKIFRRMIGLGLGSALLLGGCAVETVDTAVYDEPAQVQTEQDLGRVETDIEVADRAETPVAPSAAAVQLTSGEVILESELPSEMAEQVEPGQKLTVLVDDRSLPATVQDVALEVGENRMVALIGLDDSGDTVSPGQRAMLVGLTEATP